MYNRYVPQEHAYAPVTQPSPAPEEEAKASDEKKYIRAEGRAQAPGGNSGNFFSSSGILDGLKLGKWTELMDRDKSGAMGGLLSALKLEELDSGDILLILIILLLLVEGDNLELVITLGLMLLLGLGDNTKKSPDNTQLSGPWESSVGDGA